jgi:hypothetical protein
LGELPCPFLVVPERTPEQPTTRRRRAHPIRKATTTAMLRPWRSTAPSPSLCMCLLLLAPRSMPHDEPWRTSEGLIHRSACGLGPLRTAPPPPVVPAPKALARRSLLLALEPLHAGFVIRRYRRGGPPSAPDRVHGRVMMATDLNFPPLGSVYPPLPGPSAHHPAPDRDAVSRRVPVVAAASQAHDHRGVFPGGGALGPGHRPVRHVPLQSDLLPLVRPHDPAGAEHPLYARTWVSRRIISASSTP